MIGLDVVSVSRLQRLIEREPEITTRLLTEDERTYCMTKGDPIRSAAGIIAAKEATMKALGLRSLPAWARQIEIDHHRDGTPWASVDTRTVTVSISHDGDIAAAVAMVQPVTR